MNKSFHPDLRIIQLGPEWQQAARALILAGMEEHWGVLDPTQNPDLDDIEASFSGGIFLLALRDTELVGTGGMLHEREGVMRIVRMSVACQLRREGIGGSVLQALLSHARQVRCRQVVCETTQTWTDAVGFYLKHGFAITHRGNGDVHFAKDLGNAV
jgi:GNAT superfamily N-acetyltransferase